MKKLLVLVLTLTLAACAMPEHMRTPYCQHHMDQQKQGVLL